MSREKRKPAVVEKVQTRAYRRQKVELGTERFEGMQSVRSLAEFRANFGNDDDEPNSRDHDGCGA